MFVPLFHLFVVSLNLFTLWYDQTYVNFPFKNKVLEDLPWKARGIFLTFWCLWIQTAYFTVSVLNDVSGSNEVRLKRVPILRAIKDTLFSVAFPLAFFVSTTFWSIYAIDRELIFPKYIDAICPFWVNHVLHTTVFLFQLVELFICFREYPSRKVGFSLMLLLNIAYALWMFMVYVNYDAWAYPLFDVLNWPARLAFVMTSSAVGLFTYVFCEKINASVWQKSGGKRKIK